jgi:hypothetical protein
LIDEARQTTANADRSITAVRQDTQEVLRSADQLVDAVADAVDAIIEGEAGIYVTAAWTRPGDMSDLLEFLRGEVAECPLGFVVRKQEVRPSA